MQQRQLRLGDILDDYCPRERRLTNHAVVAMVGPEVKQTRCTTCDAEHEYKHAKVPRQRRKSEPAALYAAVLAGGPKRVVHEQPASESSPDRTLGDDVHEQDAYAAERRVADLEDAEMENSEGNGDEIAASLAGADGLAARARDAAVDEQRASEQDPEDAIEPEEGEGGELEEGPVHRPLIRATLPRLEGQPPAVRPAPDFTIRQPAGGRPNRFRRPRGPQQFQGGRPGGHPGNSMRTGSRQGGGGRPQGNHGGMRSRPPKRHGPGKRSK